MMHPLRAAPSLLALAAALVLAGCASAPPPMTAPSAAEPPPSLFGPSGAGTSPVDNEMLAIAKSEEEIDRLLPGAGRGLSPKKASPSDADAQKGDKSPSNNPATPLADGDGCATACRALASMTRSADHLCSLAGDGDGRCEDARGRVRGAGARVRSACPACAAQPSP